VEDSKDLGAGSTGVSAICIAADAKMKLESQVV